MVLFSQRAKPNANNTSSSAKSLSSMDSCKTTGALKSYTSSFLSLDDCRTGPPPSTELGVRSVGVYSRNTGEGAVAGPVGSGEDVATISVGEGTSGPADGRAAVAGEGVC